MADMFNSHKTLLWSGYLKRTSLVSLVPFDYSLIFTKTSSWTVDCTFLIV